MWTWEIVIRSICIGTMVWGPHTQETLVGKLGGRVWRAPTTVVSHIGCNAGEQEGASGAPAIGARAANLTIAIGLEAGQYGLGRFDNGHGANDNRGNIAIGYQSGWDRMYPRSVAIGYQAGRIFQGAQGTPDQLPDAGNIQDSNVAIGNYAGENNQRIGSIAVGANAGRNAQETVRPRHWPSSREDRPRVALHRPGSQGGLQHARSSSFSGRRLRRSIPKFHHRERW